MPGPECEPRFPLEANPLQLSEDEKIRYLPGRIKAGDQTLVASVDPCMKQEEEGGDGH